VTDVKWGLIAPLIPPAKRGGRRRSVDVRAIVNGLLDVMSTGCQWRYMPKDLPPQTTLCGTFGLWTYHGVINRIHHTLYLQCRKRFEREASPTAPAKPACASP
jgi:transposase